MKSGIQKIFIPAMMVMMSLTGLPLSGQKDSTVTRPSESIAENEEEIPAHSLYAGAGSGYNMIYMGSSISGDRPHYSGGLIYGFRGEFYASAYTFHLNTFEPVISFSAFSLVYAHTFNKWFDISLSASRYQVNRELSDTLFSSFFYSDLTMGFDWKILYSKLSAGALFAESNGLYFQLRNSRYFETPEIFNGKAFFSFDPYVNLLFGTLTETSDGMVVKPPFSSGRQGGGGSGGTESRFSLMEMDLGLPVSFNIGKFTVDTEIGYIFPLYKDAPSESGGFVFTLGIFFRIF